jgi:hypothetical protein
MDLHRHARRVVARPLPPLQNRERAVVVSAAEAGVTDDPAALFREEMQAVVDIFYGSASTASVEAAFKAAVMQCVSNLNARGGHILNRMEQPILEREDVAVVVSRSNNDLHAATIRKPPDSEHAIPHKTDDTAREVC